MDMKKIFYIVLAVLMTASCKFLDFDETKTTYTRESMYSTFSNITKMLTNIYGYMPGKDIVDISDAMRDCGCDDAEFGDPDGSVQRFGNGNWSALQTVDTQWSLYNGIRSANEFLESIQTVDLSMYRYDSNYQNWLRRLELYPYEARALRAYYFFELARRYGDIAMPLKILSVEEANEIGKTSFNDVIDFIVDECSDCAEHLPVSDIGALEDQSGRVTKGFAMAVKAKALLYAASPLFNTSGDREKWADAAKAALDIINSGNYRLDPGVKANSFTSPENIMVIRRSESSSFERYNFPVRFTEGKRTYMSGTYPTQNLVDAFQTLAGYDIVLTDSGWQTEDPAFDTANPYDGRDPRFAMTVLANGMAFKGSVIETFVGGADYSETRSDLGSPTGYYLRKYIQESTSFVPDQEVSNKHARIVFRYAEAILSYAEAANEYFRDPDGKDGTLTLSAREAINLVRANAGMPDVEATSYQEFQEAVRREWRVEFAFEDHRFWDIRRWKIGADTQVQIDGVNIEKNGTELTWSRKSVENRTWAERMYLYPIPQSELFCNSHLQPQNPGW